MTKLLIIRFTAIGDVVMTAPVVHDLACQYPELQITVLSKERMAAYFADMPENVTFRGVNLNKYKGLGGLFRLFRELKRENYDLVADFHDVIRSKVLRLLFCCSGGKTAHIQKGREEKKSLTQEGSEKHQLKTSFQRYADVLGKLGYPVQLTYKPEKKSHPSAAERWIGIAPFAAHAGKIYPQEKMKEVIRLLAASPENRIFLFGGGQREKQILEEWAGISPQVQSMVGKLSQQEELDLMSQLDAMISMDSANMHMASLVGTPVLSIWGATHPYAGFMGWGQSAENAVQVNLNCRPCSIFGNKPCKRGDYACLNQITPILIVERLHRIIS